MKKEQDGEIMMQGIHPRRVIGLCLAVGLSASLALAQNPTGTLKGTVAGAEGNRLPGVLVTAESDSLQGQRTAVTGQNGDYKIPLLPPGDYEVTFSLEGFATAVQRVKMSIAQTQTSNVELALATVTEEITVTSRIEQISDRSTVSTTVGGEELTKLPIGRAPLQAVNLAPGVANTGPSTEPLIHGSFSYENLYLVNGVTVNENLRGQFLPLFIEDAIQETTTTTAGVSAEYGRFSGGVVNVITKSGGNRLQGSLRASLNNDDWISDDTNRQFDPTFEQTDDVTKTYEGTLGGAFWKDKIWFFLAGRDFEESSQATTAITNITFPSGDDEERFEGKLTVAMTPSHSLIGSYLEIDRASAGTTFGTVLDLRSVSVRTDPQEIKSANYTGILTSSFFVEAQYSERDFEIATGFGGVPDLIEGTLMRHRPSGRRWWSPTFCGSCEPEIRNNENTLAKGSYFLTTADAGTHDFTFGYDTFSDIRFSVNHQSGSDFQVWAEDIVIDSSNNIFPVFRGATTWVVWWPPVGLDIAQPTDFATDSFFVNDSWQLNDKWSFNIGVRYDENDGVDSSGATVTDDSKVSPRLGTTFDVKGDGDLLLHASYGTYVAAIANSGNIADGASTGGALAGFFSTYGGPLINGDPSCGAAGTCVPTDAALRELFDWYLGAGGTQNVDDVLGGLTTPPRLFYSVIPGATVVVREGFKSPATDEIAVGVTKRLGTKGLVRADVVRREWEDFYSERNQPGDIAFGSDITEIGNFGDEILEREYTGLILSSRYRFTDRFTLAGNYTLSELEGNINGETAGAGPVSASPNSYAIYKDPSWNLPVGNLEGDQRHKIRAWGIYDLLKGEHNHLSVALLQNFFSGSPYGAVGGVDSTPFVTNPGFAQPPPAVTYFFTSRDAFKTDDITRTDLSFTYSFRWRAFGSSMEVFVSPQVLNVFDEDNVFARRAVQDVFDATNTQPTSCNGSPCQPFNPFTDTPVEGVHWAKADDFGEPDEAVDFQTPRTFRLSVGFRF
ncbi:MAG TPA: TonB-dependent receptor [Thermoanaerobaculia bacterium]|nr:TonB-dependent receptor [Thermoanaerobaculia bacterium]